VTFRFQVVWPVPRTLLRYFRVRYRADTQGLYTQYQPVPGHSHNPTLAKHRSYTPLGHFVSTFSTHMSRIALLGVTCPPLCATIKYSHAYNSTHLPLVACFLLQKPLSYSNNLHSLDNMKLVFLISVLTSLALASPCPTSTPSPTPKICNKICGGEDLVCTAGWVRLLYTLMKCSG
jgi:hypothetical protein